MAELDHHRINDKRFLCPQCGNHSIQVWQRWIAQWPFIVRCRNCGASLRARIPLWQNIGAQLLAQAAFWSASLFGFSYGLGGLFLGLLIGSMIAIAIAFVPGRFSPLEVVAKVEN
jgi:hypothetical protein